MNTLNRNFRIVYVPLCGAKWPKAFLSARAYQRRSRAGDAKGKRARLRYGHSHKLLTSNLLRWLCTRWHIASVSSDVPLSAAVLKAKIWATMSSALVGGGFDNGWGWPHRISNARTVYKILEVMVAYTHVSNR